MKRIVLYSSKSGVEPVVFMANTHQDRFLDIDNPNTINIVCSLVPFSNIQPDLAQYLIANGNLDLQTYVDYRKDSIKK